MVTYRLMMADQTEDDVQDLERFKNLWIAEDYEDRDTLDTPAEEEAFWNDRDSQDVAEEE